VLQSVAVLIFAEVEQLRLDQIIIDTKRK